MGLAKRIIPCLLHRGSTLVKGKQFAGDRSVGHVLQAARIHASRGVDELVILNIGATPAGQGPDFAMVRELTANNFTPIAIGGGIRSMEDVHALFESGADKIVIRTGAIANGSLLHDCARRFGSQAVVVAVDVRAGRVETLGAGPGPVQWCRDLANCGAGEILLTNVNQEGMMSGYDLGLIERVSKAVSIPVIAHGGCGQPQHMLEAIHFGADAVAAGSMFLFTDTTPADCARYLNQNGIEVRMPKEAHAPV